MIASRELQDATLAQELLERSLQYDPSLAAALDEALALRQKARDWEGVKNLLKAARHARARRGRHRTALDHALAAGRRVRAPAQTYRASDRGVQLRARHRARKHALGRAARALVRRRSGRLLRRIGAVDRRLDSTVIRTKASRTSCSAASTRAYATPTALGAPAKPAHLGSAPSPMKSAFTAAYATKSRKPPADRLTLADWPEYILPAEHDPA